MPTTLPLQIAEATFYAPLDTASPTDKLLGVSIAGGTVNLIAGAASELKDGTSANLAVINPANTARAATDNVLLVQALDKDGNVVDANATPSVLLDGVQTVPVPGTPVALAASTPCSSVSVTADPDNTDRVLIGNSTSRSNKLLPGQSVEINIDDLASIFVDAVVAGEGVTYIGS